MIVGEKFVGEMIVGEMIVGEMTWTQNFYRVPHIKTVTIIKQNDEFSKDIEIFLPFAPQMFDSPKEKIFSLWHIQYNDRTFACALIKFLLAKFKRLNDWYLKILVTINETMKCITVSQWFFWLTILEL